MRFAAIAGVTRRVLWIRTKSVRGGEIAPMWAWFASFLLKAFVSRVHRRMCIRIVRLLHWTWDVLMRFGSAVASHDDRLHADALGGRVIAVLYARVDLVQDGVVDGTLERSITARR